MFCSIHTADLRAVALTSLICTAAAYTLDKYHILRSFSVRHTLQMALCGSCRIHDTFQFQGCDNILALVVRVLIVIVQLDGVKTGGNYNGTILLCEDLILLLIINGTCLTYFCADTTFSCLELDTVLSVNNGNIGDCLGKRCIDGASCVQAPVKFIGILLGRAFFLAYAAACTLVHIHTSGFLADIHSKVTHEAGNLFHFTVCINVDLLMGRRFHHFRCQDTGRTVKGGEGLVKL